MRQSTMQHFPAYIFAIEDVENYTNVSNMVHEPEIST